MGVHRPVRVTADQRLILREIIRFPQSSAPEIAKAVGKSPGCVRQQVSLAAQAGDFVQTLWELCVEEAAAEEAPGYEADLWVQVWEDWFNQEAPNPPTKLVRDGIERLIWTKDGQAGLTVRDLINHRPGRKGGRPKASRVVRTRVDPSKLGSLVAGRMSSLPESDQRWLYLVNTRIPSDEEVVDESGKSRRQQVNRGKILDPEDGSPFTEQEIELALASSPYGGRKRREKLFRLHARTLHRYTRSYQQDSGVVWVSDEEQRLVGDVLTQEFRQVDWNRWQPTKPGAVEELRMKLAKRKNEKVRLSRAGRKGSVEVEASPAFGVAVGRRAAIVVKVNKGKALVELDEEPEQTSLFGGLAPNKGKGLNAIVVAICVCVRGRWWSAPPDILAPGDEILLTSHGSALWKPEGETVTVLR